MSGRPAAPLSCLALAALTACNLYFAPASQPDNGGQDARPGDDGAPWSPPLDAAAFADAGPPDAGPATYSFAACSGGMVYASTPQARDQAPADITASGTVVASCHSRCRAPGDVYECLGDPGCAHAAEWLCEPDAGCPADGTCTGNGTRSCSASAGCAIEVVTESCTCTGSYQVCTDPCGDGLCSPVQVLHQLAGHWQGTVTPPSFSGPYTVDLVIAPDGHLDPHRTDGGYGGAFYYGDDGGDPQRFFRIVGSSPSGAIGQVGVMFSTQEILPGLVTGLHVDDQHLRFQFWDSWLECSREFSFDLTRVP